MIEQKQIDVAKELDEVMLLIVGLVGDIKAKKSPGEIAAGRLGDLMNALGGMDQLDDEMRLNRKAALGVIGLRMGELADALLPK